MKNIFKKVSEWRGRARKALQLAPHIDDLYAAFEEREGEAPLSRHERELLENTLAFSQTHAESVGVPRADIVAVPVGADFEAVLEAFQKSSHTRLPVVGRDLDDVKGLVTLKDFIPLVKTPEAFKLEAILRPVNFVQESMPLNRVLQVMKKTRMPLVMVSDEFGGTSGLVTLKDVLEELVGDIEDEHDGAEPTPLVALGGNRFRVRGDYGLEDVDSHIGSDLASVFGEDVETIGGAVMRKANTIPARGETFALTPDIDATVYATDGRRILSVELKLKGALDSGDAG
jgi:magnesium and cobalt transporter